MLKPAIFSYNSCCCILDVFLPFFETVAMFDVLSSKTGLDEASIRLLVGILLGYPIALGYKNIVYNSKALRLSYLLLTGLTVGYIFCQSDLIYSIVTIIMTWQVCFIFQNSRKIALAICFLGNFGFLLYSYVTEASEGYDLNWTTCQSVLCLRLIGFAWDYYDGANPEYKGSTTGSLPWLGDISLKTLPNLPELLAYCYFFSGFLVGPLFSFRHFSNFLNNDLLAEAKSNSLEMAFWKQSKRYCIKCFFYGVFYLAFSQLLNLTFPESALMSQSYLDSPWYYKVYLVFWSGKRAFTKYFGIWKLNEGPCSLSGLSFNGFEKDVVNMKGVCNIGPYNLEIATSLRHCIDNFNVNTNQWCKLYIFKRLKFLNNKNLSAIGTLLFLAMWHGFHMGYYITFLFEFLVVAVEDQFMRITFGLQKNIFSQGLGWLFTHFMLYYPMIAFDLLHFSKIRFVYDGLYWAPYVAVIVAFFVLPIIPSINKAKNEVKIKKQ
eukprot:NODE_1_length_95616_cov_0.657642.p9 type:complete len:490 gc:universal NODE_1_length_95616_cov_0.657642:22961-21492(-)